VHLAVPVADIPDYGTEESRRSRHDPFAVALSPRTSNYGCVGPVKPLLTGARVYVTLPKDHGRIRDQVLGIVGFGAIGTAVAGRAKSLGSTSAITNPDISAGRDKALGVAPACATFDDLLRSADAISFHCTLNPSSRRMLDTRAISLLRPGAFIVNTARGGIIDEEALAAGEGRAAFKGAAAL